MSTIVQATPSWPGYSKIKHIVIFGASYCATLSDPESSAIPTAMDPLGVKYPGDPEGLYNEPTKPNWVGHLITKFRPVPAYNPDATEQDSEYLEFPLLVHNYAIGGSTVEDLSYQLSIFLKSAGSRPSWAPWTSEDTLFMTWIGINDCAYSTNHDESMKVLFAFQAKLYDAGARNFLFIGVPPVHRTPGFGLHSQGKKEPWKVYQDWNTSLLNSASAFATKHADATVAIFSSYDVFNNILDNPQAYGFHESDVGMKGAIWYDHLHPTSAMHSHIACHLSDFLETIRSP